MRRPQLDMLATRLYPLAELRYDDHPTDERGDVDPASPEPVMASRRAMLALRSPA